MLVEVGRADGELRDQAVTQLVYQRRALRIAVVARTQPPPRGCARATARIPQECRLDG